MVRKRVYQTLAEVQHVAEELSEKWGKPLWHYPVDEGFEITSKGYTTIGAPAAIPTLQAFLRDRQVREAPTEIDLDPFRVFRLRYGEAGFEQAGYLLDGWHVFNAVNDRHNVFIINIERSTQAATDAVRSYLVGFLRRENRSFIHHGWLHRHELIVCGGFPNKVAAQIVTDNPYFLYCADIAANTNFTEVLHA